MLFTSLFFLNFGLVFWPVDSLSVFIMYWGWDFYFHSEYGWSFSSYCVIQLIKFSVRQVMLAPLEMYCKIHRKLATHYYSRHFLYYFSFCVSFGKPPHSYSIICEPKQGFKRSLHAFRSHQKKYALIFK